MVRSGWGPDAATIAALGHTDTKASGMVSVPVGDIAIGFGMTVERLARAWAVQFDYGPGGVCELDIEDECSVQKVVDLFAECMKTNLTPPRKAK